ncbi:MAG: transcription antitermination factor NusB [Pseudomonadales bacterium]|nr:transcription antitermination factor NusB [Pseudomonadales bacterium]
MNDSSAPKSADKPRPAARRKARRFALQALYQWHIAGGNLSEIEAQFRNENAMHKVDLPFFHELLHKIPANVGSLDQQLEPLLDIKKDDLGVVELTALRIGAYELCHRIDIPYRVCINEGIELAKVFGAEDSYRFVNAVLDKLAKQVRSTEIKG